MKTVSMILNKKYKKDIRKLPVYKKRLLMMQKQFKEYGIACIVKDEFSYYQIEIMYEGLKNKQRFEDVYLTTYVTMHDFWQDLDYQERKHQMNVDVNRMRKELKSFPYENDEIYIPMFDQKMNRLYTQEIVLLELKQYGRFIKKFDDVILKDLYGVLPYKYNFTSCLYVSGEESSLALYNPDVNRLYFVQNHVCVSTLSFDPQRSEQSDFEEIKNIAMLAMAQKEGDLAQAILASALIQDSTKKKLEKYIKKLAKN